MTIVLCPNQERARYAFDQLVKKCGPLIEKADSHKLWIIFKSGLEYRFMSEQNSAHKLLGTHADVMYVDEFVKEIK